MKRGISAGPPYCVMPTLVDDEHSCLDVPVISCRMSLEELNRIDDNIRQGYRWGCEMRALVEEVRYYLMESHGH